MIKKPINLHSLQKSAQHEGFCVLHSGTGGIESENQTIVGMGGVCHSRANGNPENRLDSRSESGMTNGIAIGYLAYPNPTLKNDIPDRRFYTFDEIRTGCGVVSSSRAGFQTSGKLQQSVTKSQYIKKIKQIKELLAAGEIYQLCYAIRFRKKFSGDPYSLFLRLTKENPTDFSAFLNCGNYQIISASPERLFKVEKGEIITQPIKGTVQKKGGKKSLDYLMNSEKERAELDMITDLERNDVGKICKYGTLRLAKERALLELPNLWHTYSEVRGKLQKNIGPEDVIKAMFPGGSITGCPKKRAMEYLEKLEGLPRNIFTGSIGYITPNKMDMNISIRTALVKDGTIEYWAGGGIVADSDPEKEYAECLLKAEKFLKLL